MPRNTRFTGKFGRLDLRNSIRRVKDTKNFEIDKLWRFSSRGFSILLSFIMWYFLSELNSAKNQTDSTVYMSREALNMFWFLTIGGPIISVWNIAIYLAPFLTKAWSSRKILIIESVSDVLMSLFWMGTFVYAAGQAIHTCTCPQTGCTDIVKKICDKTNWLVAFAFFATLSWTISLIYDIISFYKGVFQREEVDPETLLEVQRTARMGSRV